MPVIRALFASALACLSAARGDLTYVDATSGAGGNTTLANGTSYTPPLNGTNGADQQWEQRTVFGSGGNVYESGGEGGENAPELRMKLTGLVAGGTYRVRVHFWDAGPAWRIRAGFNSSPGGNTLFANQAEAAGIGATGAVAASTLSYALVPTTFVEDDRTMYSADLGTTLANGSGEIPVFIDDLAPVLGANERTWFDGISYEAAAPVNAVRYVDATTGNTTRWDATTFAPAADGVTGADNNWERRALGNSGTVFEANFEAPENAPLLVTELTGLTPSTSYVLYAYFWTDGGNWRLKASVSVGDIQINGTPGNLADDFLPTTPPTHFAANDNAGGTATVGSLASATTFTIAPLVTEGNRTLMHANLGTATSDAGGSIKVYIDDFAAGSAVPRTWYDGVGYKPALALEPAQDEDGDGLTNGQEATLGTDPYLVDTDGDSHGDKVEVDAGSDPLKATSIPPLPGNGIGIAPDGAWTWFNDERAIFHQGSLFTGYVKGNGQYGITRYDPAAHEVFHMVISTAASQQQDDHNNPSITVLPDGKLLVIYSKHHGGSQFYQRTSLVPLPSTNADWGPEITVAMPNNHTYSNAYLLTGESNAIYNFSRCVNFNPTITKSLNNGVTWETPQQMIEVGTNNVRPYSRYCSNHTDRIDLIYTDGHPRDVDNSIYHMFYKAGAFCKTDGTLIDTMANLPLDHQGGQRGSVIYQYSNAAWGLGQGPDHWIPGARGWTWDVHYGTGGNPVCVFQVQTGTDATWATSRIFYYFARWNGTAWERKFIAQGGRGIYAAESDYGGGMSIDPSHPNVIYISSNAANPFNLADVSNVPLRANARYELYRGVTTDGGQTFTWEQLTTNSERDNLRPIVPENHGYERALLWFNGTYSSYTNYNTRVLAIMENSLSMRSSSFGGNTATLTWNSSPGQMYRITGSADLAGFPLEAAAAIESQGGTTSHTFAFPLPLHNAPKAFFRVETE
ncbi:BNR-4 repeat-containing protein [Luteolibacter arcticus]|uniref:BNR-4 repeat-containing protein n=2 Tax=Luteolibacter arcticus TaxID=1581411 RepID=A0ABT3GPV2_9BACT|nr:BNR-4 repeat-containing protein [Luteolibacter arcticus]